MMKSVAILLVVLSAASGLKLTNVQSYSLQDNPDWEGPKVKSQPSTVVFFAEYSVTGFYVNNNKQPFQFSDDDANSNKLKKQMKLVLYKGDIITITLENSYNKPKLAAEIKFLDKEGKEHIYNTDNGWYCNGKKSMESGRNDERIHANYITSRTVRAGQKLTCYFLIPCDDTN